MIVDTHKGNPSMAMRNPVIARGGALALAIVATELAVIFVGAILPTPLYPLYRQAFGFSGVTLTYLCGLCGGEPGGAVVFRTARRPDRPAHGELAGDRRRPRQHRRIRLGRRNRLAVCGPRAERILDRARGGRPATTWIAELHGGKGAKGAAARIAAAANFFGCSAGPLIGGALAQFAFWPLRLPYCIYLVLLAAVATATMFAPETVSKPKRLAEASLRPRLGVP
jgi:hypothetical protein